MLHPTWSPKYRGSGAHSPPVCRGRTFSLETRRGPDPHEQGVLSFEGTVYTLYIGASTPAKREQVHPDPEDEIP